MPRLKINNNVFYREGNISKEKINYPDGWRMGNWKQEDFIKDIEKDLIKNPAPDYVQKYQTHSQTYERMKGRQHWDDLFFKIKHSLMRYYAKEFKLYRSWANVAKEDSVFADHIHNCDITVVYYLKCDMPEYGTYITDDGVMIPAINDSLLIFNPNIKHRLTSIPPELFNSFKSYRYSIVFDFNIDIIR